jgi:glutathione synthase
VAQALVPGAAAGDKRVIVLDGQPLGAMLRRNDSGGFVHNLAAGGQAYPAQVDDQDRLICARIAPWLRERGLYLAGIDVLGGKLIEINVTSPTCVQEINRFDGVCLEAAIVDFVERQAWA